MKKTPIFIGCFTFLLFISVSLTAAQSLLLDMGSASGVSGGVVQVPLFVQSSAGAKPAELRLDIIFNAGLISFRRSLPGPAATDAEKTVYTSQFPTGSLHLTVSGTSPTVLENGIVAFLEFSINSGIPVSTTPLTFSQITARNPAGQSIHATSNNGLIILNGGIANPSELFFSQIADGKGYVTRFVLINPGNTEAFLLLELFGPDGKALNFNLNGNTDSAFLMTLPANGMEVLESSRTDERQVGWARVRSTTTIGGSIIYSYFGASGAGLFDEAGMDPSVPTGGFALTVDTRQGFNSGLAVANPNQVGVALELALYSISGALLSRTTRSLPAMSQFAAVVQELFPDTVLGSFSGAVSVTATGGNVVSTTLRFSNDLTSFASIPVLRVSADTGSNILFFPQIADGGGYRTTFLLANPGPIGISAVLETFTSAGLPLTINLNNLIQSKFSVNLPAHGIVLLESNSMGSSTRTGWARVTASGPIGGSIVYDALSVSGRLLSAAGIDPAQPTGSFCYSVDTRLGFLSGSALANLTEESTSLEFKLYKADGTLLRTQTRTLAGLSQFAELAGEIFPGTNLDNFTGIIKVTSSGSAIVGTTLRFNRDLSVFASIPVVALITTRGGVESPKEGESVSASVSGTLSGSGWAVTLSGQTGTLPAQIKVLVDGKESSQVQVTRNIDRTDIKESMARQGFTVPLDNGFRFTWNITTATVGPHLLSIQATPFSGLAVSSEIARLTINVMAAISGRGALETPRSNETVAGTVAGSGWGVILIGQNGSLPAEIKLLVDGKETSQVQFTRNVDRSDIKDTLTRQGFTVPADIGFRFTWNSTTVEVGSHVLSIQITNTTGVSVTFEVARVTVNVVPPKTARGSLETPKNGETLSGTITGSGWAVILSGQTGSLPTQIRLLVDGKDATSVQMTRNVSRPDVRAAFTNEGITVPLDTGFRFTWDTNSVAAGSYLLSLQASDTTGVAAVFEIARITVTVKR